MTSRKNYEVASEAVPSPLQGNGVIQPQTYPFTSFADIYRNDPQYHCGSMEQIGEDLFEKHQPCSEKNKDVRFFLPCSIRQGSRGARADVAQVSCLVLDIDKQKNSDLEVLYQKMADINNIIYTTFSHTEELACLRVILFLRHPLIAAPEQPDLLRSMYKSLFIKAISYFQVAADINCATPEHLFAFPCNNVASNAEPEIGGVGQAKFIDDVLKDYKVTETPKFTSCSDKDNDFVKAELVIRDAFYGHIEYRENHGFFGYKDGIWRPLSRTTLGNTVRECFKADVKSAKIAENIMKAMEYLCGTVERGDCNTLICLKDQVINPITQEVHPHDPGHGFCAQLPFSWDEVVSAGEPIQLQQVLDQMFGQDEDGQQKIDFLQCWLGYVLIPSSRFHAMLWLVGNGANGKSVLLELMALLVGKSNVSTVSLDELGGRFSGGDLYGKLLNVVSELDSRAKINEGSLKKYVTGDLTKCEEKYKKAFSYNPFVRFVVATNVLPNIKDVSDGFYRRLTLIRCNRQFAKHEQDPYLMEKLKQELPAIFKWALEGLNKLLTQGGFPPVPSSEDESAQLRRDSDSVLAFKEDFHLQPHPTNRMIRRDLYAAYTDWCAQEGLTPVQGNTFGRRIKEYGIQSTSSGNKRYYQCTIGEANPRRATKRPTRTQESLEEVIA